MKAVGYYITRVIAYFISLLPWAMMYAISDFAFLCLWYLVRYRRKVVITNMRHAFPGRSKDEIRRMAKTHYRFFADLTLETLRLSFISERSVLKRVSVDEELLQHYAANDQSICLIMPHYANWEIFGQRISIGMPHVPCPIYKPLTNRYFDRMIYDVRSRFGAEPIRTGRVLRQLVKDRKRLTMPIFLADQKPFGEEAVWVNFLNQDTPAFKGVYVIARKFDYPLVYMDLRRTKRGYYHVAFETITDTPNEHSIEEMAAAFFRHAEKRIKSEPECWLWTHKRWKGKNGEDDIYNSERQIKRPSEIGSEQ